MSRHRVKPPRRLRLPAFLLARVEHRRRAVVVAVAAIGVVLLGAGIAVAAWTSTGSGTVQAKAGTALPPTVGQVGTEAFTSGLLYPGGTGDVKLTIGNPNPYPVRVASIVAGSSPITVDSAAGECTEHGVTFSAPASLSGTDAIAAGASLTLTLPAAVTMASTAENGCQDAVFAIPVTVTVVSG